MRRFFLIQYRYLTLNSGFVKSFYSLTQFLAYNCFKMAQSKVVLYSSFISSCSWRVRISLAFKNINYECKSVNLFEGEQLEEDFLKLNPSGKIPALVHNGNVFTKSTAILEYLEEVVPTPRLLPVDPVKRAKVRALVDTIVADIQPLQNIGVLMFVGETQQEWGKHWVEKGFTALERYLQDSRGQYCFGDEVTLADVCLVPQVFNSVTRFKMDLKQFPLINEISSRLLELPAFKNTHPFVQPDCPEELKKR